MSTLFIDYAVFGLLIIAAFAFNIYNNVSGPKEKTKADYIFASGRSTSTWAMLLSIARGFLGVRVFLGKKENIVICIFNTGRDFFFV